MAQSLWRFRTRCRLSDSVGRRHALPVLYRCAVNPGILPFGAAHGAALQITDSVFSVAAHGAAPQEFA